MSDFFKDLEVYLHYREEVPFTDRDVFMDGHFEPFPSSPVISRSDRHYPTDDPALAAKLFAFYRLPTLATTQKTLGKIVDDSPRLREEKDRLTRIIAGYVDLTAELLRDPNFDLVSRESFATDFLNVNRKLLIRNFSDVDGFKGYLLRTKDSALAPLAGLILAQICYREFYKEFPQGNTPEHNDSYAEYFAAVTQHKIPGMWKYFFEETGRILQHEDTAMHIGGWSWLKARLPNEALGALLEDEEFCAAINTPGKEPPFADVVHVASVETAINHFVRLVENHPSTRPERTALLIEFLEYVYEVAAHPQELLGALSAVAGTESTREKFKEQLKTVLVERSTVESGAVLKEGISLDEVAEYFFDHDVPEFTGDTAVMFARVLYSGAIGDVHSEKFAALRAGVVEQLKPLAQETSFPVAR